MVIEGRGGEVQTGDGGLSAIRLGHTGATIVGQGYGRYYENVSRGNVFLAAMQASAALGTVLTATAVTLTLYNPIGSGINASLLRTTLAIMTAPAGSAAYVYAINTNPAAAAPTATTAAAGFGSALLSTTTGKVKAFTAATLSGVPGVGAVLASILATGSTSAAQFIDDIGGAIVLQPGTAVTIQGIGTASSGIVGMLWEEIPI